MPTIIDRTWRVQIFTDLGTDPRIEFLRERVKTYEDGDVLRTTLPTAARSLSAIAAQTLPGGPRKIATYGELAAAISECGHAIAAEDAAALAAVEKAAKAAAKKPASDSVAVGG
jgi:hypothetical protein